MLGALIGGICILIFIALAVLLPGFLFGTTIGNLLLAFVAIACLCALFVWTRKSKKLSAPPGWQPRYNANPSIPLDQKPEPYLGFAPAGGWSPPVRISPEELAEAEIIVPHRYCCLAKELQPLISLLRDAFVSRQVPGCTPWPGLDAAFSGVLPHLAQCTSAFVSTFNRLGQILARVDVTDSQIGEAVKELTAIVEELVEIYRRLWHRPFPSGQEKGQLLFSAILERVMRSILENFEQITTVVDRPKEAVARFGVAAIPLQLVLEADEEIAAFNRWLQGERLLAQEKTPSQDGLGILAAVFLLGWWVGRDR